MSDIGDACRLLDDARAVVAQPAPGSVGAWPRAAAFLARQSLETGLAALWAAREPMLAELSTRTQLSCLPVYLRDPRLAGEIAYTWVVLSEACHHRGYEMGPTAEELDARFEVVERLLDRFRDVLPAGRGGC